MDISLLKSRLQAVIGESAPAQGLNRYFWNRMAPRSWNLFVSCCFLLLACHSSSKIQKQPSDFVEQLMADHPEQFKGVLEKRDSFRVQIIYTQVDRKKNNKPVFTDYYFNVDQRNYYYPASTVKLPTALLALERINKLHREGVTGESSMITEAAFSKQTPVYNDPTTLDGRPTLDQYIRKILLVSDNDAFNRLYEFLGQEYINKELHHKRYDSTAVLHRLSIAMTEEENRHTNPIRFFDTGAKLLYSQPMKYNSAPYPARKDSIARGYYAGGKLNNNAMNFSTKNRLPLQELHKMMRAVLFPGSVPKKQRFKLTDDQYQFVRKYLSLYPSESGIPSYDTTTYWDAYGKFLYWGGEKGALPKSIRSFSKEGDAYGFLIDAAYIVDFDKHVEFMISAVIYCNTDGILNDDKYDYDSIGLPFLKNLGRVIYEYELKRPRTRKPDLSTFRIDYQN